MRMIEMEILVVLSNWPSKEHPYLVYLFGRLNKEFEGLNFFMLNPSKNLTFAKELIGEADVIKIISKSTYRWKLSLNPYRWLQPLKTFAFNPLETIRVFRRLFKDGYTVFRAIRHLLYFHSLIGRKFDIVYINALQTAKHFSLSSFFYKTPILASSRGQDFELNPNGYDQILNQLSGLHVLADYQLDFAIARGFDVEKIMKIYPATLPFSELWNRSPIKREKIRIISVSRLYWMKGYSYALRCIQLLKERLGETFEYVIIGDGYDRDEINVQINRLKLNNSVILTGWLDQQAVNTWLMNSDIFLMLSIGEGFNNSVMQAQHFGLPCVVSDAGGLQENVLHDQTGFVVARYDYRQAVSALEKLIIDEQLRISMGDNAGRRSREGFDLDHQVKQYANFWRRAIIEDSKKK